MKRLRFWVTCGAAVMLAGSTPSLISRVAAAEKAKKADKEIISGHSDKGLQAAYEDAVKQIRITTEAPRKFRVKDITGVQNDTIAGIVSTSTTVTLEVDR